MNLSLGLSRGKGIYLLNTATRIKEFPAGAVIKKPPANAEDVRDLVLIPGSGRSPGEGHGNLLQYSCLENPHGHRSLVGYSPWGSKELETTE